MGWCRKGADMLSHIRIYWKSGSNMLEVVQTQEKIMTLAVKGFEYE